MMEAQVYGDHAASCPVLPAVKQAMITALDTHLGNPSARHHAAGRASAAVVDLARKELAALVGAEGGELVFTSGASEAISHGILGVAERSLGRRDRFVGGSADHAAVAAALARVRAAGGDVVTMAVDAAGRLDAQGLDLIDDRTALVCTLLVNNETGVIHDPAPLAARCRQHGALLLIDASQAPLRLALDLGTLGGDLVVLSAHKMHGPTGVGALWIRSGLGLPPLIHGGGQENGHRGGTPDLIALAGWAAACAWLRAEGIEVRARLRQLGDLAEIALLRALSGLRIQGAATTRAPGISMLTLPGLPRGWLAGLSRVQVSGGSACSSGSGGPSRVLNAMGVAAADAANSLRLSLGAGTTAAEVEVAVADIIATARRLGTQAQS